MGNIELSFNAINGSVTILEINDENIIGLFNFQSEDYQGEILSITEGEFDIVRD